MDHPQVTHQVRRTRLTVAAGVLALAVAAAVEVSAHVPSECEPHGVRMNEAAAGKVDIGKDMQMAAGMLPHLDTATKVQFTEHIVELMERYVALDAEQTSAMQDALNCIADSVRQNPDGLAGACESEWATYRDQYFVALDISKQHLHAENEALNYEEAHKTAQHVLMVDRFNLLACLAIE